MPLLEVFTPMVLFMHVFLAFVGVNNLYLGPEGISIRMEEEVTRQTWGPELNKGQSLGSQLG